VGQRRLAVRPGEDPLDQRAGLVVAGLPDREDRVEVDVRIDERRGEQPAGGVELDVVAREGGAGRDDPGDVVALGEDVEEARRRRCRVRRVAAGGGRIQARVADEQTRGGLPPPRWSAL
jgi:hypothetical protein